MVQVATAFTFGTSVATISLPTAAQGAGNGIVAGWGFTGPNGPSANQLQRLNVEILTHQNCLSRVGSTSWMDVNKICILTRQGQGSCSGDSGGPLFIGRTVIGVVSWGFVPCGSTRPDVLERAFSHRSWILGLIQ